MTSSKHVAALLLLALVSGCAERVTRATAPPASVPSSLPRAPRITAEALIDTPVCLGFLPRGNAAYVLTTNHDPSIPEWYVRVEPLGAATGPTLDAMARTSDPDVAMRTLAAHVEPINDLIRDHGLVACTTTRARPDGSLEVTVRGTRTTISYRDGALLIAPDGEPPLVRPQTEADDLELVAAYTAPTMPLVAVVLRDLVDGVVTVERTEWVILGAPAASRRAPSIAG